jgi:hypothetical protein
VTAAAAIEDVGATSPGRRVASVTVGFGYGLGDLTFRFGDLPSQEGGSSWELEYRPISPDVLWIMRCPMKTKMTLVAALLLVALNLTAAGAEKSVKTR